MDTFRTSPPRRVCTSRRSLIMVEHGEIPEGDTQVERLTSGHESREMQQQHVKVNAPETLGYPLRLTVYLDGARW
jgi:hypothetical protein